MEDNKFQIVEEDSNNNRIEDSIEVVKTPDKVSVDSKEETFEEEINIGVTKKFYFGFEARIIASVIVILLLFVGACFLGLKVINHTTTQYVIYLENADLNYQVCLKNAECAPENDVYDSSLINIVKVTFKYDAKYEKKIKTNSFYRVDAIVSAHSKDDYSLLYKKDITLAEKTPLYSDNNEYTATEILTIDYNKYKELLRDSNDMDKQVDVVFYIEENNETRKVAGLVIPLSKDSFDLNKYTTANTTRTAKIKVNVWDTYSLIYGIATSILTIVSLILIYKTTRLVLKVTNNKNDYEDAIDSLLKEYDNLIIVARDGYESMIEREVVKIDEFEELVKVRDRINKPIIFSRVNNVKSEFIVEDDNILYKYVLKESDFTD